MCILTLMDHPNIVKILDMGTFNPQATPAWPPFPHASTHPRSRLSTNRSQSDKIGNDGPAVQEYFEGGEASRARGG